MVKAEHFLFDVEGEGLLAFAALEDEDAFGRSLQQEQQPADVVEQPAHKQALRDRVMPLAGQQSAGQPTGDAVFPERSDIYQMIRHLVERLDHGGGQHKVLNLTEADELDGFRQSADLRRHPVKGAVGQPQQARGQALVFFQDCDNLLDRRLGVLNCLGQLVVKGWQRGELAGALRESFGVRRHAPNSPGVPPPRAISAAARLMASCRTRYNCRVVEGNMLKPAVDLSLSFAPGLGRKAGLSALRFLLGDFSDDAYRGNTPHLQHAKVLRRQDAAALEKHGSVEIHHVGRNDHTGFQILDGYHHNDLVRAQQTADRR